MATKKIVIPKGLINPNQTSVIEIPDNLQDSNVVIARNVTGSSGGGSSGGYQHFGDSSSGGYRGASQFGSSGSGAGYKGGSGFSAGSYSGGGLSPPPNTYVPACYEMNQPGGGDLSYREFRHHAHERGGAITSSPYGHIGFDEDDEEDPEFEESIAEQMGLLTNLEFVEYDQLMDDLNQFQRFRRRLEQDLSNMGCPK